MFEGIKVLHQDKDVTVWGAKDADGIYVYAGCFAPFDNKYTVGTMPQSGEEQIVDRVSWA